MTFDKLALTKRLPLVFLHILVYLGSGAIFGIFQLERFPLGYAFVAVLIWISVVDFEDYRIPNMASVLLLILGVIQVSVWTTVTALETLLIACVWPILFWVVSASYLKLRGRIGLGLGDVKLVAGLAVWVGFEGMITVVLFSSLAGIATILLISFLRHDVKTSRSTMPVAFGPFLCFFAWVIWIQGVV